MNSIHSFQIDGINGNKINFADFSGKKILIVNVASECGLTGQYQQLQELYTNFSERLVIVGIPCNDFGSQEPGNEESILEFCSLRYGVRFPMAAKVKIKGVNAHPIYRWLTQKSENGVLDSEVSWNFQKYLLDESGVLIKSLSPTISPLDDEILTWLSA